MEGSVRRDSVGELYAHTNDMSEEKPVGIPHLAGGEIPKEASYAHQGQMPVQDGIELHPLPPQVQQQQQYDKRPTYPLAATPRAGSLAADDRWHGFDRRFYMILWEYA